VPTTDREGDVDAMSRRKTPCQQYEQGETASGNRLQALYFAAAKVDELPKQLRRQDHIIEHGYAVAALGL
jgi:hypothetical protein